MYQEWESPSFTMDHLVKFCLEFFKSKQFRVQTEMKGTMKAVVIADIEPISERQSLVIEKIGSMLRLTFPPLSRSSSRFATIGTLFGTGVRVRNETEKQMVLDRIEEQFWGRLEERVAEIQSQVSGGQ